MFIEKRYIKLKRKAFRIKIYQTSLLGFSVSVKLLINFVSFKENIYLLTRYNHSKLCLRVQDFAMSNQIKLYSLLWCDNSDCDWTYHVTWCVEAFCRKSNLQNTVVMLTLRRVFLVNLRIMWFEGEDSKQMLQKKMNNFSFQRKRRKKMKTWKVFVFKTSKSSKNFHLFFIF